MKYSLVQKGNNSCNDIQNFTNMICWFLIKM